MTKLTPPWLARGVFQLREPFKADVKTAYRVTAIRTFQEILSRHTDPMVLVYNPVGLGEEFYQKDQAAEANIITLASDKGEEIYVPDTYILSYPNMGDVEYAQLILAVSLGALPLSFPTDALEADIQDLVKNTIGVAPEVRIARSSILTSVTSDEHVQLTQARQGSLAARDDDATRVKVLESQLASANERLRLYEQYIQQLKG